MTTSTIHESRLGLALKAYGIQLHLWKERAEREWGATLSMDNTILHSNFEEDNLMMAKLHILGEARTLAMSRSGSVDLPGCDTLLNSWRPVKISNP